MIRQLCANSHLGVQEPPALFALRDDQDEELITDSNMSRKIKAGRNFKLCSSPTIEAAEMVDKLSSRDEKALKMATYSLQRLVRDKPFYDEFLHRGGLEELVSITMLLDSGNTLAYALTCIQNLMECRDERSSGLGSDFIRKVSKPKRDLHLYNKLISEFSSGGQDTSTSGTNQRLSSCHCHSQDFGRYEGEGSHEIRFK